ncbi:MAG: type I restriction endonuclease subunit R [Trichodesmium sp.]
MSNPDSEAALEKETIKYFQQLGYTTANCYDEWKTGNSTLGRETKSEVILTSQLYPAIQKLNPHLPLEAVNQTIEIFSSDRSLSTENTNREIYNLLKNGLNITYRNDNQEDIPQTIQLIDWRTPNNNNFFLASQFWITGETYRKRADLISFINGIPLIFIELKAHTEPVEKAFNDNFTDYKTTIPQLFQYNGLVILSNGSQAKLGSITSKWEYFSDWKQINSEGETGIIALETLIRGTCDKSKLLDIVENFTLFVEEKGKLAKIIARNHQYLGVNNAVASVEKIPENQGKLGVFWHTQGSGKSYSMQFFAQKVHRILHGNWTFVVITDREDLDKQIYQNFAKTGAVTEAEENVRATSGRHLKQLLTEDHRYIFTLIQKFRTAPGETYPKLSDRNNIIVMADEAHRSQYDIYARNMRSALPNAAFIGFTGTPLIAGEEEATRREFGEYVSIYNFRQSIEDGATVPLYYENRVPELQLTNEQLNDDITNAIEKADVDEEVEVRLAQEFSRQYEIIVRDNRLEAIAADIVSHFLNRGFLGKAMIVSIDRFTTVKMYDKVQHYWEQHLQELRQKLSTAAEKEREKIANKIKYMEETDMAVIVSASQNEKAAFEKKGLNILPHRERLAKEKPSLDEKFKDENNGLRIVFVCAMWMTGFDVPSCSTIYIDKPMKNHTLMQTIARANRVFQDKNNGLIVDYIGVLRNLQVALAIYGSSSGGGVAEGDIPVKSKLELVEELKGVIGETDNFLMELKVSLKQLETTEEISQRINLFDDAVDAIVAKEISN